MFSTFMAGFMMMSGLIIAIGAQNTFVLKQGLLRQHVLLVAGVCWLCDLFLMAAGIWGLAAAVQRYSGLLPVLSVAGAVFLAAYGLFALVRAWRGGQALAVQAQNGARRQSAKSALLLTLGLTLLNPHVYLDTVLLVGSVAAPLAPEGKWAFWLGASALSGLWFFGLGFGARLLLPLFKREATWRLLDSAIALMMFYLAYGLLREVF